MLNHGSTAMIAVAIASVARSATSSTLRRWAKPKIRSRSRRMIAGRVRTDLAPDPLDTGADYDNDGCDAVIGVSLDLAGTRAGRVLGEVGWRIYRWRHPVSAPDPTHGRIDADIQATVEEMQPPTLGQRVAMENTLQHRRDLTS